MMHQFPASRIVRLTEEGAEVKNLQAPSGRV
jgi:hypothetical protein